MRWTRYARRAPSHDVAPVAEPRGWRLCLTAVLLVLPLILGGCLASPRQPGAADGSYASASPALTVPAETHGDIVRMAQSAGAGSVTSSEPDTSSLDPVKP